VALAWSGLVDQVLEQSLLLRPTKHVLQTNAGFYLGRADDAAEKRPADSPAEIFRRWLLENR
ncbi:MAG: LysR family transcriptional regulator, partial [Gammaproteobacteria bacterium]|nr:LysR family transcriptional regulator [Gammaproteobacteria bacterium]